MTQVARPSSPNQLAIALPAVQQSAIDDPQRKLDAAIEQAKSARQAYLEVMTQKMTLADLETLHSNISAIIQTVENCVLENEELSDSTTEKMSGVLAARTEIAERVTRLKTAQAASRLDEPREPVVAESKRRRSVHWEDAENQDSNAMSEEWRQYYATMNTRLKALEKILQKLSDNAKAMLEEVAPAPKPNLSVRRVSFSDDIVRAHERRRSIETPSTSPGTSPGTSPVNSDSDKALLEAWDNLEKVAERNMKELRRDIATVGAN